MTISTATTCRSPSATTSFASRLSQRVLQLRSRRIASTQALPGASQSVKLTSTRRRVRSTSSTVAPAALPAGSDRYLAQTGTPIALTC